MVLYYMYHGWWLKLAPPQIPLRCMEALQLEGRARALKIPQPKSKARAPPSNPKAKPAPTPPAASEVEQPAAPKRRVKTKSAK